MTKAYGGYSENSEEARILTQPGHAMEGFLGDVTMEMCWEGAPCFRVGKVAKA